MKITLTRTPGREVLDKLEEAFPSKTFREGMEVSVSRKQAGILSDNGCAVLADEPPAASDEPPVEIKAVPESNVKTSQKKTGKTIANE